MIFARALPMFLPFPFLSNNCSFVPCFWRLPWFSCESETTTNLNWLIASHEQPNEAVVEISPDTVQADINLILVKKPAKTTNLTNLRLHILLMFLSSLMIVPTLKICTSHCLETDFGKEKPPVCFWQWCWPNPRRTPGCARKWNPDCANLTIIRNQVRWIQQWGDPSDCAMDPPWGPGHIISAEHFEVRENSRSFLGLKSRIKISMPYVGNTSKLYQMRFVCQCTCRSGCGLSHHQILSRNQNGLT